MDDQGPPILLDGKDIDGVIKYMKSPQCKNIFIMAGAGISTAAGIPDFRSPKTGLYSNLKKLNLPYPEAVFDIGFFRRNPAPFYTLAHELAPGRFRPTLTHAFIKLLADKGRLHTCFTQNIDTLERVAGVPPDKIVEAHGSFAGQHCIDCHAAYDDARMRAAIASKEIPRCKCKGLVKPDIVFFGEALPDAFAKAVPALAHADLLLVLGTSLTVHPFAGLTRRVSCPRVLINLEAAGDIGQRSDDVVILAKSDTVVRQIAEGLGWLKQLEAEWARTEMKPGVSLGDAETPAVAETARPADEGKPADEAVLQKQVDKITEGVEQVLQDAPGDADVDKAAAALEKLGLSDTGGGKPSYAPAGDAETRAGDEEASAGGKL